MYDGKIKVNDTEVQIELTDEHVYHQNDDGSFTPIKETLRELQSQIGQGGNLTGSGMSESAKNLLITILRNAMYSTDQSGNITLLANALGGSDTPVTPPSGGDDEPTTPTLQSITVTWSGDSADVGTDPRTLITSVKANYSDGTSQTVTGYTVTPLALVEGSQTVTVTYNGKSATKSIIGNAIAVPGETVTSEPVWSLASEMLCDGTQTAVDTDVYIYGNGNNVALDEIFSRSIFVDFTSTQRKGYLVSVNTIQILSIGYNNGYHCRAYVLGANGDSYDSHELSVRMKYLIVFTSKGTKSTTSAKLYTMKNGTSEEYSFTNYQYNGFIEETIKVANGFVGTIHDAKIWDRELTSSEIDELMN